MNKNKTTIAVSLILAALFAVMILLALPVSKATPNTQQSRSLTVEQRKNSPVIVTSMKLGDTNITPNARFQTSPTWTEDLKITVRNDGEQPISYIEVYVAIDDYAQRRTVVHASYIFGDPEGGHERLAPGESVVLTKAHRTVGDPTTPGLIRVTPLRVQWNGDASREWFAGFEQYRDPDSPEIYRREPAPRPSLIFLHCLL
jgi:hypothetical protein